MDFGEGKICCTMCKDETISFVIKWFEFNGLTCKVKKNKEWVELIIGAPNLNMPITERVLTSDTILEVEKLLTECLEVMGKYEIKYLEEK